MYSNVPTISLMVKQIRLLFSIPMYYYVVCIFILGSHT